MSAPFVMLSYFFIVIARMRVRIILKDIYFAK